MTFSEPEFLIQVKSLLRKDVMLKRQRKCSLCCDFICPIVGALLLVAAFFFVEDTSRGITQSASSDFTVNINPSGSANDAEPFPIACVGHGALVFPTDDSRAFKLYQVLYRQSPQLALLLMDAFTFPDAAANKTFGVGPGKIGDKLQAYFTSRTEKRRTKGGHPKKLYNSLDDCKCSKKDTMDGFACCLAKCKKEPVSPDCEKDKLTPFTEVPNDPLAESKKCEILTTACKCAENIECGWLEEESDAGFTVKTCMKKTTSGGAYRSGVSCESCSAEDLPRESCTLSAIWKKIDARIATLTPRVLIVEDDEKLATEVANDVDICGGLVFDTDLSETVRYTLHGIQSVPEQPFMTLLPDSLYFRLQTGPALHLQQVANEFITCSNSTKCLDSSHHKFSNDAAEHIRIGTFPIPSKRNSAILDVVYEFMPVIFKWTITILSLVWSVHLLREKEWKVKDAMHAHGVRLSSYYTALSLFMLVWSILCCVLPSLLLVTMPKMVGEHSGFETSASTFFLILWLTLWNSYALMAFLTVLFRETFPSVFFLWGIFQISSYVLKQITKDVTSHSIIFLSNLHPGINIGRACEIVRTLDLSVQANDFSLKHRHFSLMDTVWANVCGIILWHLLFFYFDMILQEGSTYRWYFFCMKSFWFRSKDQNYMPVGSNQTKNLEPPSALEMEASRTQHVIQISNLTKKYGNFTAVNGINATMYAGGIFALLGHNGAGKTTTFGMISGMTSIDGGMINIFGRSMEEHLKNHRNKVGLCPQQNLVWPLLTIDDHLRLFSSFKGIKRNKAAEEDVNAILSMLGLSTKKFAQVSTLSGGMVRKLCLAMSLLGDPDVLLLDEPTSGLDPTARREVWDMLLSRKHNRVVILSTHYMEEADALGDRVAIMNKGIIECNGSPSFLRDKYGCGYNLTCLMKPNCKGIQKRDLRDLVDKHCNPVGAKPEPVQVLTNVGREITFVLRFSAAKYFPTLFVELDKASTRVESYSVGVSNLEEVFLKVASQYDHKKKDKGVMTAIARKTGNMENIGGVAAGKASFRNQFLACLSKRLFYARRKWLFELFTCCGPVAFVVLAIVVATAITPTAERTLLQIPEGDPLYIPRAPTAVAAGVGTNTTHLRENAYSKQMLEALKESEFNTLTPIWELAPTRKPFCAPTKCMAKEHDANVKKMARFLESHEPDGTLRYAAFILPMSTPEVFATSLMVNLRARESPGMALNLYANAILQANNQSGRIVAYTKSLPASNSDRKKNARSSTSSLIPGMLLTGIGIAALIFTTLILVEKDKGIWTQQAAIGLRSAPYWLSNWVVDSTVHLVALLSTFGVLLLADVTTFVGHEYDQFALTLLLFVTCALAQPLFCYFICMIFKSTNSSSMLLFFGNVVVAQLLVTSGPILDGMLSKLGEDGASSMWHEVLLITLWIARLSPGFALTYGLNDLEYLVGDFWKHSPLSFLDDDYFEKCLKDAARKKRFALECSHGVWDLPVGPARNLMMLVVSLVVWPLLMATLFTLKNREAYKSFFRANQPPLATKKKLNGVDVRREEARVDKLDASKNPNNVILARNVRKVYKVSGQKHSHVHAVQGISFASNVGEVFGLLGVNGAGKSSMFKMLAGEDDPSDGYLRVDRDRGIGYCPQNDPLWDCLTPREHLLFTCRVKGIDPAKLGDVVTDLMTAVDLSEYADVHSVRLSGGNKRKLCVAMGLVGTPKILFLDEPSAGVDPLSRRFMWSIIQKVAERDKSMTVVLTTHSMEECEALCTRTAIMVNGVFRCIGPNSSIREMHGEGATLDVSFFAKKRRSANFFEQCKVRKSVQSLTYMQVQKLARKYPYHAKVLNSVASCFRSVADIVIEKKTFDLRDPIDRHRVETSMCTKSVVAEWWNNVALCGAFVKKLEGKLGISGAIRCEEIHGEKYRFKVLLERLELNDVFGAMEALKGRHVEDYTLSRATLESIFNRFAREAVENKEYSKKCF